MLPVLGNCGLMTEKLYQEIISYFDKGKVSVGLLVFCVKGKWKMIAVLQCRSDADQPEVAQNPQVKDTVPPKGSSLFRHQPEVQGAPGCPHF